MDKRTENLVRQYEGKCCHFNGIMSEKCDAGVNYRELAGVELGMALALPCLPSDEKHTERREKLGIVAKTCDKLQRITRQEAEGKAKDVIERSAQFMVVCNAAHADAKKKGLGKGHGGNSEMSCPSSCGGTLRYSVAGYNGHMHAACTTPSCVRWME